MRLRCSAVPGSEWTITSAGHRGHSTSQGQPDYQRCWPGFELGDGQAPANRWRQSLGSRRQSLGTRRQSRGDPKAARGDPKAVHGVPKAVPGARSVARQAARCWTSRARHSEHNGLSQPQSEYVPKQPWQRTSTTTHRQLGENVLVGVFDTSPFPVPMRQVTFDMPIGDALDTGLAPSYRRGPAHAECRQGAACPITVRPLPVLIHAEDRAVRSRPYASR